MSTVEKRDLPPGRGAIGLRAAGWLGVARLYALGVWFLAKKLGIWLPGLGFLCRRVDREHVFAALGRQYVFYPPAASMYAALLVGRSMEPETHRFFARVIPQVSADLRFIDVGAAIGEMMLDVAGYPNVVEVVGFDPDPDNVEACRRSARANGFGHIALIEKIVADRVEEVDFRMNRRRGTSGQILDHEDGTTQRLRTTTLDREIQVHPGLYLVLVDVEGAELRVLQGATRFLAATQPLVVFECITGRDRHLESTAAVFGPQYDIYRLRSDGYLDQDMRRTWNCVAVHRTSPFHAICARLVHEEHASRRS